jgi:transcriptional regulator with XRE-family HTH domain
MIVMPTLGNLVRERRLYLGMTQQELGDQVGARRSAIEAIENGRTAQPTVPMLNRLADALKLPVEDLGRAMGLKLREQAEPVGAAEERVLSEIESAIRWIRRQQPPPTTENG